MRISEKKEILSHEELKKIKRRRARARTAVITTFVLLLLVVVLMILFRTVLFPIEKVMVEGNQTIASTEIIEESNISIGDKLFSVSSRQLNKKLTVKFPYIKSVKIKYPSFKEIKFIIKETTDVFCYKVGTSYFTADQDNKILSEVLEQPQDTTLIIQKNEISPKCGYLLEINKGDFACVQDLYKYFKKHDIELNLVDISNMSSVELKIKNRFIVHLGGLNDLDGKLEHLKGMLPEIDAKNGGDITGEIELSAWSSNKREGFFKPKTLQ